VLRVLSTALLALIMTGCDPCSGLTVPTPAASSRPAGEGTRVDVHLPHLGEVALKRWGGPRGNKRLERAARATDGSIVTVEVRPYRLRLNGDPADPEGLLFRGDAEIVVREDRRVLRREAASLRLPVEILLGTIGTGWTLTADPRVLTEVTLPSLGDPALTRAARDLAVEVIPRILGGRPLLTVAHAPPEPPRVHARDMSLTLAWRAQRRALIPKIAPHAAPSIGNTAAVTVGGGELAGRTVEVDGPDGPLRATLIDMRSTRGGLWTTVRLEEVGACSWVEARLPVGAGVTDGRVRLRALGPSERLRSAGPLGGADLEETLVAASERALGPLQALSLRGPSGAPTKAVLGRSTRGAVIKEINLGGLGGGSLTPPEGPKAPPRPKGR